ncbi:MAG: prepilin-type N-terminal cleavage/methylation domain-containing protein [Candidatus Zixiibacteriota bacterium]
MIKSKSESGFTLVEVVMVIIIMAIIAAVAMRSMDKGLETARIEETRNEMNQLAEAIAGNPSLYSNGMRTSFGYVGDVGSLPASLDALTTNPGYGTWRGPYIRTDFSGYAGDFKKDAWGQLYAYTGNITILSTGGSDTLARSIAQLASDLTANSLTGTVTDAAGNPPGDSAANVRIIITYPNGSGGTRDSSLTPSSGGAFNFPNCLPIGNHKVRAVNLTTSDTVQTFVCVFPKSQVQASLRMPGALWAAESGGGGGGSSQIIFVPGTASTYGSQNSYVQFDIKNTGTIAVQVSSMRLSYTFAAYYRRIFWNGTRVVNSSNPWPGNGQSVTYSALKNLMAGEQATIKIEYFRASPSGGSRVNMAGRSFSVQCSDGTTLDITLP